MLSSSGSLNQPYEYVGREGYYREEFDLYLLGVRWYDSEVGRFISRDPMLSLIHINNRIVSILPYAQDLLYPYLYVKNNPVHYLDPKGLKEISLSWREEKYEECKKEAARIVADCILGILGSMSVPETAICLIGCIATAGGGTPAYSACLSVCGVVMGVVDILLIQSCEQIEKELTKSCDKFYHWCKCKASSL